MLTISEVSRLIGVTPATLRRWDKKGHLVPKRTLGGHRRYSLKQLADFLPEDIDIPVEESQSQPKSTYIYARVSSVKQKKDGNLDRQVDRLKQFCKENFTDGLPVKIVKEYGSGLNPLRKGLWRVIKNVKEGRVERLVNAYKDRLTRFGFPFLEYTCKNYGVPIYEAETGMNTTLEEQLVTDLMALIASFSGKLYQLRALQARRYSREEKEKKKIEAVIERYIRRETDKKKNMPVKNFARGSVCSLILA